jgi:hypothetical protein
MTDFLQRRLLGEKLAPAIQVDNFLPAPPSFVEHDS